MGELKRAWWARISLSGTIRPCGIYSQARNLFKEVLDPLEIYSDGSDTPQNLFKAV
jgi:hypothetical protein